MITQVKSAWYRNQIDSSQYRWLFPFACFCLGLVVILIFQQPTLALKYEDGFEYLRGAVSIANGRGYLAQNGSTQTVFPPGYSLVIAMVMILLQEPMTSALLVSSVTSALSVTLTFMMANYWYGAKVAVIAAVLFILLPLRVWLGQSILSESLTLTLTLGAIWAFTQRTWPVGLQGGIVGFALGWAYLTRPESLIIILGLLTFAFVQAWRRKRKWSFVLMSTTILICIMAAYIGWLRTQTGYWTVSGKVNESVLGIWGARGQGMQDVAWRRLNEDSSVIDVVVPVLTPQIFVEHFLKNLSHFKDRFLTNIGIAPLASFVCFWGALGILKYIVRHRDWEQAVLLSTISSLFLFYCLFAPEDRFLLQIAPLSVWCMALGTTELAGWLHQSWKTTTIRYTQLLSEGIAISLLIIILCSYLLRLYTTQFPNDTYEASRQLGELISNGLSEQKDVGILGDYPDVAYFANIRHEWLPYAEDLTSLRKYATHKRALYLVISSNEMQSPATAQLTNGNFAQSEARLIEMLQAGQTNLYLFQLVPFGQN
jgi:hypothetical protein